MKKLFIILISLLSISGSMSAKIKYNAFTGKTTFIDEKILRLEEFYFVVGVPYCPDKDNTLKKGEELYPFKFVKLDEENYIYLTLDCFDRTVTTTLNRHYTGYSKTKRTTESHYTLKPKYLKFIDVITSNWDKKLHGIDYCKLSQEDKQFVTGNFNHEMMGQYIRILSPIPIPEVMKALNIDISDKELADLHLNDEEQMMNIERLLQYWFKPQTKFIK